MTTEYLRWVNPEHQRLINNRNNIDRRIVELKTFIEEQTITGKNHRICLDLLTKVLSSIEDSAISSLFNTTYVDTAEYAIRGCDNNISSYKYSIRQLMDSLAAVNESLSNVHGSDKEVHIPTAKAKLKGYPGVDPRSLSFGSDYIGPYMRWTSSGIKMCPDENPHKWIVAHSGMPVIPLQPVVTKVYLHNADVLMTHKRGQSAWCSYKYGGRHQRPHPHIMGSGAPCLGDFQAPLAEAVDELDFQTVVTLIKLFLERTITHDPAGANWVKYFTKWLPYGYVHLDLEYFSGSNRCLYQVIEREERGLYDIHRYDSNKELLDITPHPYNGLF